MAENERLITLKNISDQVVTTMWDNLPIEFQPDEEKTLPYGTGLHLRDNNQSTLTVVNEFMGIAPEVVRTEVTLVNHGEDALDLMWDGVPYVFEPEEPKSLEKSLAAALILQARSKSGELEVVEKDSGPEEKPVKISDLAKSLEMTSKDLLARLADLGFDGAADWKASTKIPAATVDEVSTLVATQPVDPTVPEASTE